MRLIGMAERALELMCKRALSRTTFGKPVAEQGVVGEWIAGARIRIEQARLLVLKTAWLMDTVGNKGAHTEIQAIKIAVPQMAEWVIDKAIQMHGAGGVSQDFAARRRCGPVPDRCAWPTGRTRFTWPRSPSVNCASTRPLRSKGRPMPEAVIVAAARSPIGRAGKGSLVDLRPDDLTATIIKAALAKVPELDPTTIDDLMLGCGLPGGEQGFNMARAVAVLLGYDQLPGCTITRYCSSSLQTTRMAMHAIRAGEGHAFISAGVETVSRYVKGNSDSWPDTTNPVFDPAKERTAARAADGADEWHDPRSDGLVPDVYMAMGQTAENLALLKGVTRQDMDEFGVRSQNLAEKAIADGFWQREITPVTLPDGRVVSADDGPRAGVTFEGVSGLKPVFRPDGRVTAGNCCPLNDGAAAADRHERHPRSGTRHQAAGPDRVDRDLRTLPGDHGSRTSRGVQARAGSGRPDHDRHRPGRDQRGVCRPGDPVLPRPRDSRWRS